ncbi:Gfo/Idh/MocA family oxidoreductase [Clostridium sp. SYSU_GA19001]|uniref:Gfo/Idh/MocA family protein n=1 Tax=Clostridium caldaquaticum TaxID=2940653 RepID=UPI0020778E11|nr:Gfo/Idh/MocA family oxidoreductase [Clostridium caldaquaticum]MCM8709950.1 Gfo/Idh/MocA family oxidoreductase [Clostridium caldaquaticum]
MRKVKIGVIGCGVISNTYLTNITNMYKTLEVVAVADMFKEKAEETAKRFNIPNSCTVSELLANPEIEIVLNLTIPAAHTEINIAALEAGKHVYCEKPLALNLEDAKKTLEIAKNKGLMVGCAPDTFLGAGIQTCKKIIDEGWIGEPVAATANMICHGHESWHPAPEFYYKEGAGPMMDMGPYYITALVSLLGPISKTHCFAKKSFNQRTITSTSPLKGKKVDVDVLTHYSGTMEFKNGVIANINMSFDIWHSNLPCLEIYGTAGTLIVPDPNMFGGPVKILRGENMLDSVEGLSTGEAVVKIHSPEMLNFVKEIPLMYHHIAMNARGLGLLDMAYSLVKGRKHRANGELMYHVTEALTSFDKSANEGMIYKMTSTCEIPKPIPLGLEVGELD